jgi:glucose-6-phosphate 1-epimerase
MAQHGFARNSTWSIVTEDIGSDYVEAVFQLDFTQDTLAQWPHPFTLHYIVHLSSSGLSCTFQIYNCSDIPFDCHALFHTYFKLENISDVNINGFQNFYFYDKTLDGAYLLDTNASIVVSRECDRLYVSTPKRELPDICIAMNNTTSNVSNVMKVSKKAYISSCDEHGHTDDDESLVEKRPVPTDTVFWNPWVDKSKALADMDDEGYTHFVCIEPGTVSNLVTVPPYKMLVLKQHLAA